MRSVIFPAFVFMKHVNTIDYQTCWIKHNALNALTFIAYFFYLPRMDAYVPSGYIIDAADMDILLKLQQERVDPTWWLGVWKALRLTRAADVKMSSDVEPVWANVDLDSRTRLFALYCMLTCLYLVS